VNCVNCEETLIWQLSALVEAVAVPSDHSYYYRTSDAFWLRDSHGCSVSTPPRLQMHPRARTRKFWGHIWGLVKLHVHPEGEDSFLLGRKGVGG